MTPTRRTSSAPTIREAEATGDALCAALAGAGIVLPSVRIDPVSCAYDVPRPLIELGRCNLDTARRLVAVLRADGDR